MLDLKKPKELLFLAVKFVEPKLLSMLLLKIGFVL